MTNAGNVANFHAANKSAFFKFKQKNQVKQEMAFTITDTKLYIPAVTLSTQGNAKLLQQLKSGFKRTINWNKYQSKVIIQAPNSYLDYLNQPSFWRENRLQGFSNSVERWGGDQNFCWGKGIFFLQWGDLHKEFLSIV